MEIAMLKTVRCLLAISGLVLASPGFAADNYPSRPITLIVPYAAGGGVDSVARVTANALGERLGQTVVIENFPGAGGIIATQRVARAEPDGYTLLFAVENTMAVAKLVQPKTVQYDSQKDFAPISLIGTAPLVLVGKKPLPANNISELMALMRANPGKYTYASSGVGTSLQVLGEMINVEGNVKMVHVPYRAAPDILTDIMGNRIDLAVLPLNMAIPAYRNGDIKIFGTSEKGRSKLAPDLPSLSDLPDLKNVTMTVWYALFAPAGTDATKIDSLYRATAAALSDPEMKAKLRDSYFLDPVGSSPSELATFLTSEIAKFAPIVKAANINAE
jgi:tripartite-type tricarboxylate transporter receptor subunit TctC